jgi:hypothetical protein
MRFLVAFAVLLLAAPAFGKLTILERIKGKVAKTEADGGSLNCLTVSQMGHASAHEHRCYLGALLTVKRCATGSLPSSWGDDPMGKAWALFKKTTPPQDRIVNVFKAMADHAKSPTTSISSWYHVNKYSINESYNESVLPHIGESIKNKWPVILAIGKNEAKMGHYVVVSGVDNYTKPTLLEINDPWGAKLNHQGKASWCNAPASNSVALSGAKTKQDNGKEKYCCRASHRWKIQRVYYSKSYHTVNPDFKLQTGGEEDESWDDDAAEAPEDAL